MNKLLRYLLLSICVLSIKSVYGTQTPVGMNPTEAGIVTPSGWTKFTVKPNTKAVETGNPHLTAHIFDLSNSMKDSQERIFRSVGLIPMIICVENNLNHEINICENALKYNLGVSPKKAATTILKNIQLKKGGTYLSVSLFYSFIAASAATLCYSLPFVDMAAYGSDAFTTIAPTAYSGLSYLGQIPGAPIIAATTMLFCGIKYLTPCNLMNLTNRLVDGYTHLIATIHSPSTNIKDFNEVEKFLMENENSNLIVPSKSNAQFLVFVRNTDAQKINNNTAFPVLDFVLN